MSFEQQLKQLEEIVHRMESGDLPLEESLKLFEQGMQLSQACTDELNRAEGRIRVLTEKRGAAERVAEDLSTDEDIRF